MSSYGQNDIESLLIQAIDYYKQDKLDVARNIYNKILRDSPVNLEALEWRGEIAIQQEDYEQAIEDLEKVKKSQGDDFTEYSKLGLAYYETENSVKAVDNLVQAIKVDGDDEVAHANLGRALYDFVIADHKQEGRAIAQWWLKTFPKNSDALHMGAAIGQGQSPIRANDVYVGSVFDDFAPSFNKKLTELNYQAPKLIFDFLKPRLRRKNLNALDMGCGTGLCGRWLKSYSARLDGVDLSSNMLDEARKEGNYTNLYQEEGTSFLEKTNETYDVIVAADVFCYFGELMNIFELLCKNLRNNGSLCFSLETAQIDTAYKLTTSGRYVHNSSIVLGMLKNAGFQNYISQRVTLRTEYGHPVYGHIYRCTI